VSFCSSHLAIKKLLQYSFYENLKNQFFRKNFKKVFVLQRKHVHKSKISNAIISKATTIWKNDPIFSNFTQNFTEKK
jgi:hypothetical protein